VGRKSLGGSFFAWRDVEFAWRDVESWKSGGEHDLHKAWFPLVEAMEPLDSL